MRLTFHAGVAKHYYRFDVRRQSAVVQCKREAV